MAKLQSGKAAMCFATLKLCHASSFFLEKLTALGTNVFDAHFFKARVRLTFLDIFAAQGSGGTAAVFDDVPGIAS